MRASIPKLLALLAWATYGGAALAQTPTLEFAAGAGNPTGNGPSITNQVITFQNNTDNPSTSNTFATYTPTLTATFALSNQQYTNNQYSSTNTGVAFGAGNNANGTSASALALFPLMNLLSGTGNTSSLYTSANATSGGIDVTVNRSVELTTDVMVLPTSVPANQRYQYADLTITFNRPAVNPVVHLTGLGGSFVLTNNNTTTTNGFTSELDLLTSGVTLSKLSGSSELTVSTTGGTSNLGQITNPTTNPGANTGSGAASGSVLVSTPAAGITTLQFRVYLRPLAAGGQIHDNNTHAGDGWLVGVSELTPLTGYVFEDVNYGGGSGRPSTASGAVVRSGATVELYNSSGTLVGTTTTDATGQYSFSVLPATYTVRVVNRTVTSSRTGYAAGLLPVQTYNGTSTRVGGENPRYTDAAANSGSQTLAALSSGTVTPESIASVTVGGSTSNTTGPDFGYNFDTVVNTNDAGQGSLRQFITNANALGAEASLAQAGSNTAGALPTGTETSIFMIPSGAAVAGLLASTNGGPASQLTSGGVASIAPATALPTITGANTTIDGSTQTQNIGDTNTVTLGTGGTVGTAGTALAQLNGREVQLVGGRSTYDGLAVNAGTVTIRSLSIYGFANDISVSTDVTNTLIERNVLGASATSFTDPGASARSTGQGVYLNNSDNGIVRNNLIGFNGGMGIWVYGDTNGANNNSLTGNEINGNAQEVNANGEGLVFDGIELQGASTGNTISRNLITATLGNGIDNFGNTVGGNTITGNTISNNGVGVVNGTGQEGSGIRLYAATNTTTVSNNVLSGNNGSGVLLENTAAKVTISQNSTFGNTRLGIDLLSNTDANTTATTYNGNTGTTSNVTLNSSATTGANGLANYPIITAATLSGTNLIVTGYSKPLAAIELFIAQPNASTAASPNNLFGQGKTYLTTVTEGTSDNDSRTGLSYSGTINGFNQGSDTNANGFSFTIPLTAAQQALVTAGVKLTATSTLSNATSEFSGIANVNTAPVPNTLTNANIPNTNGATVLSPNLSGAANGTANGATNTISYYTLTSLPSSGTLTYNGTVLTSSNIATTQLTPALLNKLTYTPAAGFSGNVSFTYTATDANGVVSTTNNNGGTVASGPATYTIPIGIADVTVSLSGQTTLNAGQPTGPITAIFTNEGPSTATNVTQTVMLPAGATVTGLQQSAILSTYPNATFSTANPNTANSVTTINFGTVASLASTASSTVTFAFTAPSATGTSTLTGATSTANSEGNNLAPDQSALTLTTVAAADVTAAITTSSTATTGTFNVTFGNAGAQSAAGVTRTVQLPAGLTGVTVSTSGSGETGTYNSTTGLVTYVVTNSSTISSPTLASNSTLTSTITYTIVSGAAPATATANVSTTTNEGGLTSNNSATATMASAFDLTTTLTGPTKALSGSPTMLYITTTNLGPNAAPTATQTVSIPSAAALTNVFITNGGTYSYNTSTNVGTVTFPTLANVPSGQTVTNTISFNAPGSSYNPSATVSTTSAGETSTANNVAYLNGSTSSTSGTSYVSTTTSAASAPTANEATTIAADATVVSAGTVVNYTVTATDKGPSNTANVVEKVQLLPGLTTASLKVANTTGTLSSTTNIISFSTAAGTTTYDPKTGILTYPTLTSQTSGTTNTFEKLSVTMPAAVGNDGQLLATASVTNDLNDPVPADNTAAVVVKVTTSADLATTISGPGSTVAGTTTSYTATFTNNGAATATSVVETVQLPTGLSSVVVSNSSNTVVTNAYNSITGLVTLPTVASDAIGTTQSYTIAFLAPGQAYAVSSAVSSGTIDNVGTNNAASLNTTVSPNSDVAINVSGPATAVVGNPVTYAVTATNNGPSAATGVAPTLQLPAGLSNVVVQAADGTTLSGAYNSTSGLVTFTSFGLAAGDSQLGLVSFTMPNASSSYVIGAGAVSTTSTDAVSSNNTAAVTTSVSATTTDAPDLSTTITTTSTSPVTAGSSVTYTMSFINNSTTTAAPAVVPVAYLPAGLASVIIKDASGTVVTNAYNSATGQVTFPTIASQAAGNTTAYTVTLTAPSNGMLAVASAVSSNDTDPTPANNYAIKSLAITSAYDAVTTLTGPSTAWPGSSNVYTVTTTNNGPSTATASTTQTVTLPSGVTATNISGGGTQSGTTITFPAISSQASGTNGEVVNTFTIAMPSTGSLALSATVASANESNKGNNTASVTTNQANQAPVAQNVWNTLQSARGNTSTTGLPISALTATDSDGTINSTGYVVVALPASTQGVLYYNNALAVAGQPVTANGLRFIPTAGYVGDATFTYTATDNSGAVSNIALYTIPVAQDQSTTYSIYNTNKGGANPYVTNDVLAQTIDPNTVQYNSSGLVYNATTGVLLSGAANGLATSDINAVLASGSTLPAGVSLNAATGTIYVSNASQLPRSSVDQPYTVNVTTTDLNGGTNTIPVTFTIGANATPLPVVLTAFTAQAVQNRDALLTWATASELANDHFDLERSFDALAFTPIGQVAGHGTRATAATYSFTDAGVALKASGPVYYRLRQVDTDGTSTYSPVRAVSFTTLAPGSLRLFPNPVVSVTRLDLSPLPATTTVQAQLLDATGRTVRSWSLAGGQAQPLDLTDLASGSYLLQLTSTQPDGSSLHQVLRLTKE